MGIVNFFGALGEPDVSLLQDSQFTYTGTYDFIEEGKRDWKVQFTSSGVFTPKKNLVVDIFCVGGGASGGRYKNSLSGGGAGGFTLTVLNLPLEANHSYPITVGAGGNHGVILPDTSIGCQAGGASIFQYNNLAYFAPGAVATSNWQASSGGCGGGGGTTTTGSYGGTGGSNGSDGTKANSGDNHQPGFGAHITTAEFGEEGNTLYAGGGGGARSSSTTPRKGGAGGGGDGATSAADGVDGQPNTGGGGGGGWMTSSSNQRSPGNGGSGIVIIRNHREV